MRFTILMPMLLVTVMLGACRSRTGDTNVQQIRRVDGSYVSAGEIEEYVAAVMDSAGVTGLQMAVISDGEMVYAHEWGLKSRRSGRIPNQETVFPGLSFSKPTFACLVMQLVENGLLELDRPLVEYLDRPIGEYREWEDLKDDPRMLEITARRVLTHTTGWPNHRALTGEGELTFVFPPGERFSYSGEGFRFLQLAVENITGRSLDVLARESLFVPLDMSQTSYAWEQAFEENNADGHTERQERIKRSRGVEPSAAGSMMTTASDFARLLLAVVNGEVLKQDSIDQMIAPQIPVVSRRMFGPMASEVADDNEVIHLAWGLGWGLFDTEFGRAFFHTGHDVGWENYTVTYMDKKIGIVLLSNSNNFESVAQRIVEHVVGDRSSPFTWLGYQPFDPSVPPPAPESEQDTVAIDPSIFDEVAGQYEIQPGDWIFLRVEDASLVGSGDGNDWDDVMAVSKTEFFIDGKPYSFTFSRDSDGTVTGLVILYQGQEIPAKKVK
jgi:CubicO group peptidase (beta-lactamase class C family)